MSEDYRCTCTSQDDPIIWAFKAQSMTNIQLLMEANIDLSCETFRSTLKSMRFCIMNQNLPLLTLLVESGMNLIDLIQYPLGTDILRLVIMVNYFFFNVEILFGALKILP